MLTKQHLTESTFFLIFVAGLAAMAPFSVDMYLPTLPDLAASFGADIAVANLTVSTFMIGMAIGQLLGGPLSDQLGRKTIGLTGLLIFIGSTLLIIYATSIEAVLIARVFQAVGGGFCSVICMAQARDVFAPEAVIKKFANIILVVLIAPMIAPTIGAMLVGWGWRSVFWVLIGYAVLMIGLYLLLIPETHSARSGRFGLGKMFRGYAAAISHRTQGRLLALRFAIFSGFSSAVLFSYVTNASFIFIEYYALTAFQFAAIFALMAAMLMLGNRLSTLLIDKIPAPKILRWANCLQLLVTSLLVLLCAFTTPTFWLVVFGLALLIMCNGAISPVASGYYISLFKENIGSASSFNASMMFALGALIGGLAAVLSQGQLLPIFAVMLVASAVARLMLRSTQTQPTKHRS